MPPSISQPISIVCRGINHVTLKPGRISLFVARDCVTSSLVVFGLSRNSFSELWLLCLESRLVFLLLWPTLLCCRRPTRVVISFLSPCGGLGQEVCFKPFFSLASQEYLLQKKCLIDTFISHFSPLSIDKNVRIFKLADPDWSFWSQKRNYIYIM